MTSKVTKKKNKKHPPQAFKQPAKPLKLQQPTANKFEKFFPLIVFLFAFLLYSNTLNHGFVMDDGADITNNVTVQKGIKAIPEIFKESSVFGSTGENFGPYRPLTLTLFAFIKEFFGNHSPTFHFVSVLLYAVLCVVIYFLIRKFFYKYHFLFPLVVTLLFVAHPVHVEVAANIKSTDEILSLLFCSFAAFAAHSYVTKSSKFKIFKLFFFFTCAMFTKESAITFVVIIPMMLYFFIEGVSWKKLFTVGAILASGAVFYVICRNIAVEQIPQDIMVINNTVAKADFTGRYSTISWIMLYYLRLLIFPNVLSWDYSYNQIPLKSWGDPMVILSLFIYASMIAFALLKLKAKNIYSFCILFFLGTIILTTNIFILIIATMAERFLFTPSLAFCIALTVLFFKISGKQANKAVIATMLLVFLIPYSIKTFSRNKDWKSNLTLFESGAKTSPNSYRTNMAYGWEELTAGEKETDSLKKKQFFETALYHLKRGTGIYGKMANDWYNLGVAFGHVNNTDSAIVSYREAVAIDPNLRNANYNLGALLMGKKDYKNALPYFLKVEQTDKDFMDIQFKIALAYHFLGDAQNAIPHYEKFLVTNPGNPDATTNLAIAKRTVGQH